MPDLQSFLERVVETDDGHWLWTGAISGNGRGYCQVNGKTVAATRVSWELRHGAAPVGMHLHHTCPVKLCVNPDHLEPMTKQQHAKEHHPIASACLRGHKFDAQNTYITPQGRRQCRACNRYRKRRAYQAASLVP